MIHTVVLGYPNAKYKFNHSRFQIYESQMQYPDWYRDKFKTELATGTQGVKYNYELARQLDYRDGPHVIDKARTEWDDKAIKLWNWRNHDLRMVYWYRDVWLNHERKNVEDRTHVLFIEPDVLVAEHVTNEWINNSLQIHEKNVYVPRVFERLDAQVLNWKWWPDAEKLNDFEVDLHDHLLCIPPSACVLMPIEALKDLLWMHNHTDIFQRDVFCEIRLPTLLSYLGYHIYSEDLFDGVRTFPKPVNTYKTPFAHPFK